MPSVFPQHVVVRNLIQHHKWSGLSLAITIGMAAGMFSYTDYQYRVHHVQHFDIAPIVGGCVLLSVITASVAICEETASAISTAALNACSLQFRLLHGLIVQNSPIPPIADTPRR
jgi:hypothetical protein